MNIRKSNIEDINNILKIYSMARKFMCDSGNKNQWVKGYPSYEDVERDIKDNCSFVCEIDGEIVGTFYFHKGIDETYLKIYDGKWLKEGDYAVIHRVAVKYHGMGIADFIFSTCFNEFPNIRIDTHKDNLPMQKSLLKNGFVKCGKIYLKNGSERLAYQKI